MMVDLLRVIIVSTGQVLLATEGWAQWTIGGMGSRWLVMAFMGEGKCLVQTTPCCMAGATLATCHVIAQGWTPVQGHNVVGHAAERLRVAAACRIPTTVVLQAISGGGAGRQNRHTEDQ